MVGAAGKGARLFRLRGVPDAVSRKVPGSRSGVGRLQRPNRNGRVAFAHFTTLVAWAGGAVSGLTLALGYLREFHHLVWATKK